MSNAIVPGQPPKKLAIVPGQPLKSRWFVPPGEEVVVIVIADLEENDLVGISYTRADVEAMLEAMDKPK